MLKELRPAVSLIVLFTIVLGAVFPLALTGLFGALLPYQAGGSLIRANGQAIGSALIGQDFTSERYFHSRPSALMGADPKDASKQIPTPYDASESGASNLAPTSKALIDRVQGDIAKLGAGSVPGDAVTSSGSGLDPDISPQYAGIQVLRVAKARNLSEQVVLQLVAQHSAGRLLGFIGEPRVNVLALNRALDAAAPAATAPTGGAVR